jgi:hypothetical protein
VWIKLCEKSRQALSRVRVLDTDIKSTGVQIKEFLLYLLMNAREQLTIVKSLTNIVMVIDSGVMKVA